MIKTAWFPGSVRGLAWVVLLLAAEGLALRFGRWLAIEMALHISSPRLTVLVSHRDLVKGLLFGVIGLAVLLSRDVLQAANRERLLAYRPSRKILLFNAVSFVFLGGLLWKLPAPSVVSQLDDDLVFVLIYGALAAGWFAVVVSAAMMLLPPDWLRSLLRRNQSGVIAVAGGVLAYIFAQNYLSHFEGVWSGVFLKPTIAIATRFARLLGMDDVAHTGSSFFGTPGFTVDIGPTCLGYQGVSLVLLVLAGYFAINRRQLRFPNVLAVLPIAIVLLLLLNALRIVFLVAIGTYASPEVAVMGFHSTAGWVELILTLAMVLFVITRYAFFTTVPRIEVGTSALQREELFFLPLAALIGVSFLTQLMTGSFYWSYPMHILVAAWVAWKIHPKLPPLDISSPLLGVITGLLVFGLWIILIRPDADAAMLFRDHLFAVAPAWAAGWLFLRVAGAAIVVPLVEELAFRAGLLRLIERRASAMLSPGWARGAGLAVSTAAFAILHDDWLAASLAGLCYGALYLRRGSLGDTVLAHAVTNFALALYVMVWERWSYW
jgi:exosortase E/protease (VPEID-CTERM system)